MDEVNYWIQMMLQMGLYQGWIGNKMPNASKCDSLSKIISSHGQSLMVLAMPEMHGLFSLVQIGLAVSLAIFCGEVACHQAVSRMLKKAKRVYIGI
jgi:hypothetical protein